MISSATIEAVKEKASLFEVVSESVSLKRVGSNFVGLCPFHGERTPSFHIRDDKFYHCFGCAESGNAISFVMRQRGLSFPEAVEDLAQRFGIQVQYEGKQHKPEGRTDTRSLYKVNRLVASFFARSLQSASPEVVSYIQERGISTAAMAAFGLGFAPNERASLASFLASKRVPEEYMRQLGLVRRSQRGDWYDTFRGRLIFPIFVDSKRIAGFGGRLIPALFDDQARNQAPKYLNSPESPLYQKSKIFFGLPHAMSAARQEGELLVVEGYLDVLGLWQVDIKNVVATCGTAITEDHVQKLKRLVKRVTILFDGDLAGRSSAGKAFGTFLNSGLDVSALFLPEGEDPDTFALQHGEQTRTALAGVRRASLFDCYMDYVLSQYGVREPKELGAALKGQACDQIGNVLRAIENSIEQGDLIQRAALRFSVRGKELEDLVRRGARVERSAQPISADSDAQESQAGTSPIPPAEQLSPLDRDILRIVMVRKLALTGEVLNDPDLCIAVHPAVLQFVQELHDVLSRGVVSQGTAGASLAIEQRSKIEERVRESVKRLLEDYGLSWLKLWKEAYEMQKDPEVDFDQSMSQCRRAVRKGKLIQAISQVEERLKDFLPEQEKVQLVQEKLLLSRQLDCQ